MSETASVPPATPPAKRGLRRFWPVIPLGLILIALMLEDLHVMGYSPFESDACGTAELDQSSVSAKLYAPLARWGVNHAGLPRVAIVTIDSTTEPAELLTNTCASRAFMAKLLPALVELGANVVVIDKYYSDAACTDEAVNRAFKGALAASKNMPIVLGQPTSIVKDNAKLDGCLAQAPGLTGLATNVRTGLTRLNEDTLKIPIRWPIYSAAAAGTTPNKLGDSAEETLSLVAARAQVPGIDDAPAMQSFKASGIHPYTTFLELPTIPAMVAICSASGDHRYPDGTPIPCDAKQWTRSASDLDGKKLTLRGQVAVIGDISDQDMQPFPGGDRPGVFLQANYIESLLDQRFLAETPIAVTLIVLILYVIAVYALYWAHDQDERPLLTPEKAGLWSLALLGVLALLSVIGLLTLNLFTPVWALWGAAFFMVFRYLEASGHHRSQHLLGHLAGHSGHAVAEHPATSTEKDHP